ncbi:MAG TPA: response regulator [Candidatus Binatia bacterium]|nr:response regulator [Candidatus Binatia bacterium]
MGDVLSSQTSDAVLLAEDSDDDILLFQRAYSSAGVHSPLHIVRDGEEAIRYLKGRGKFTDRTLYPVPRLLVVDLKMPRRNGFDVIQWVRRESDLKALHIIVLTTSGDLSDVKRAYETGANSFVTKSLDLQEFVQQLKDVKSHWL